MTRRAMRAAIRARVRPARAPRIWRPRPSTARTVAERVLPPTAGLPLRAADLLPWGDADLATALAQWLGVPAVQLECSGTSALMVALQTLRRLAPGRSEVIAPAYTCPLVALAVAHCGLQLDRKSTRLNSSHSQISYAVFCLKKKKKH